MNIDCATLGPNDGPAFCIDIYNTAKEYDIDPIAQCCQVDSSFTSKLVGTGECSDFGMTEVPGSSQKSGST